MFSNVTHLREVSRTPTNYLRAAGGRYFFFDDSDPQLTMNAWRKAKSAGGSLVAYRQPLIGWLSYMQGTRLIVPCPAHQHENRHSSGKVWCIKCGVYEDISMVED